MLTRRDALKLGMIGAAAVIADVEAQPKAPWFVWNDAARPPIRGGYFRRAATLDVGLLNPNHWPVNDWLVISQIHEKLLITDGSYRPAPWLAESWIFPNAVTCVMKLRENVHFSDGSPFNAAAVKFVQDWIVDPKNGCWDAGWLKPLKSVDILDEQTVRWNFHEPWGGFLGVMANVPGYMLSPKALAGDPKRYDTQPVGTGPYIIEDRNPGAWIKVRRNPNWWFGKSIGRPDMPYFDGLITTVIPDPSVQLANFKAGKLDGIVIGKSQYDALKGDPNAETHVEPVNHLRDYIFNHTRPPFYDIRARQAVAYAIDRNALIAGIEFGMGRIASCLYPDDHWAHNPELSPWPFDPGRAKALLRNAGYGRGLTINGYVINDPQSAARAEAVKGMLADVGIAWKVDTLQPTAAMERLRNLEFNLSAGDWLWIYDPDLIASGRYHPTGGFNFGRSRNEQAIALIERGRRTVDVDARRPIYHELEKVLYENCEDVYLFWEVVPTALSRRIAGYDHTMAVRYKEAWARSHPLWFKDGRAA